MMLLEVGGLGALVFTILLVLNLPAIILIIIGLVRRKRKPESAKKLFIIAALYLIIGWGLCGTMMG